MNPSNINKKILQTFETVDLEGVQSKELMQRYDKKFILDSNLMEALMGDLNDEYLLLEINGKSILRYRTLYFDTKDFRFYKEHHNGKLNRKKVRIRNYQDSNTYYLEVKAKSNKGITNKVRCQVDNFSSIQHPNYERFLKTLGVQETIEPKLFNSFKRITLVNKFHNERVTLDFDLKLSINDQLTSVKSKAILEVKSSQEKTKTKVLDLLKTNRIRPSRFSKYCIGVSYLSNVKSNNFKEVIKKIEKPKTF